MPAKASAPAGLSTGLANRIIKAWVFGVLLALVITPRVSADPALALESDALARAEQGVQSPEYSCQRLNEQGEKVDCWCAKAVARAESREIREIVSELDRHIATWRQENLLEWATKPCLKRCAEAFDRVIDRTAGEILRYEAAADLLSRLAGKVPQGLCPEAEKHNEQLLHYECWLRKGDITDTQYGLLRSYGYSSPAHNSSRRTIYLTNVRSRAARQSCMLACCGRAPPAYPATRIAD